MALSNYDCLAFNTDALPCNGVFNHFKSKSSILIHKNWIYVSSEEMWNEDVCNFIKPTIAHIASGDIQLAGFNITSVRGPQDSIFVYASCTDNESEKSVHYHFAGIGCAGYKDKVSEVLKSLGRVPKDDELWCYGSDHTGKHYIVRYFENGEAEQIDYWDERTQGPYDYSSDWVGVLPSTLEAFFKWLSNLEDYENGFKEWVEKCKKSVALRFNQGDMFFAKNAGVELAATKPGECQAPVFNEIINAMDKDNECE